MNSPPPKPEVILTNFFAEPTVLLVPITSRDIICEASSEIGNSSDACSTHIIVIKIAKVRVSFIIICDVRYYDKGTNLYVNSQSKVIDIKDTERAISFTILKYSTLINMKICVLLLVSVGKPRTDSVPPTMQSQIPKSRDVTLFF